MEANRNSLASRLVSLGLYSKPAADLYVAALESDQVAGIEAALTSGAGIRKSTGTIVVMRPADRN